MANLSDRVITAATYNIHYSIGTDRRFAPERIADVIVGLNADVVALQEVGWHYRGRADIDQFALLGELTGYDVHSGLVRNHRNAHFGNAILTRKATPRTRPLDLSIRFRAPRGALIADFGSGGDAFRIVNVHLGLDPWERRAQITRLLGELDGAEAVPTLLLGDFNEWRRSPAYLDPVDQQFPECGLPDSYHARRPMVPLDRIYLSPQFRLIHACAVDSRVARQASDHLPVVATIVRRHGVEPSVGLARPAPTGDQPVAVH